MLSPGMSRKLGLTWGFSTGSPWSVLGDLWPATDAASTKDSDAASGSPPLTWDISPSFKEVTVFFHGAFCHLVEMSCLGTPWFSKAPADTLSVAMS